MKFFAIGLLAGLTVFSVAGAPVKGYAKKDGTYVQPHQRTSPNFTSRDNYGTKGNTNPYTGKAGTKEATN